MIGRSYWVIQHISSMELFPACKRATHAVFGQGVPRLFSRKGAATRSLNAWLAGVQTMKSNRHEGEYDVWIEVAKKPDRKREDYEFVEVSLLPIHIVNQHMFRVLTNLR